MTTLQSNHENNQESNGTAKLKSSSAECEETEPLIAAASKHSSTYGGHTSSTKHDGSFVNSVDSVEGEDFNNIH